MQYDETDLQLEVAYNPEGEDTGPDLEDYDYPAASLTRARGKFLSQRAVERHHPSLVQQAQGWGDQTTLTSGHFLALSEHPRKGWNDL